MAQENLTASDAADSVKLFRHAELSSVDSKTKNVPLVYITSEKLVSTWISGFTVDGVGAV